MQAPTVSGIPDIGDLIEGSQELGRGIRELTQGATEAAR
jgi:hypothetical protein